ncbi:hypothetical protein VTL71DRAFT_7230 [Oculimacula yallundae]|uniref:Heterokaryon incompatibility domain-containing protein n=1 Tax=Oculimacula yallundae TaxID=86028 RepID=A0ABR4BW45_9HELO
MPEEFKYTTLKDPESDLRLIQIACGQQDDELNCTLTVYTQNSLRHRSYNALSYTWGDANVKTPITLNGEIFFVTPNLDAALRNIRCSTAGERGRQLPLWVDAICINQNDVEERDDQVRRMKDIYESAEWVIIWLGNYHEPCDEKIVINESRWGIDNSGRAPEADTGAATQLALCLGYMLDDPAKDQTFPDGTKNYPSEVTNLQAWAQLARLFQRPWFERLWIIQEISVSQRAMVLCGGYMILWSQLEAAARYILQPMGIPVPSHVRKLLPLMAAHRMIQVSLNSMWNIDKKNILTILHSTQEAKCLDPRDKLYAILAIVEDTEDIQIDYSTPVEQTYRTWAEKSLRRTKSLDILSACCDSSRLGDLPSWVPDLRRPFGQDKPLWIYSHLTGYRPPSHRRMKGELYQDSADLQISQDGLTLSVHGYSSGVITQLSSVGDVVSNLEDPTNLRTRLQHIIAEWADFFASQPRYSVGYTMLEEVIMRYFRIEKISPSYYRPSPSHFRTWSNPQELGSPWMQELERFLFPRIHGCQLFSTHEGGGGAVPGACQAQIGDEIWTLQGGLTPYILRRATSHTHRLISPCYFEGEMDCIVGTFDTNKEIRRVSLV